VLRVFQNHSEQQAIHHPARCLTRETALAHHLPTPTCTHHRSTEIRCLACRGPMRLVSIEPGGPGFELRSFACATCIIGENFLMSIAPPSPDSPQASRRAGLRDESV
jgi:hypothetical protein